MRGAVNTLRGSVKIEIRGDYPERFLNLCADGGIALRELRRISETHYTAAVTPRAYLKARPLADRALCTVRIIGRSGLPFIAWRIRRRYALIAGLLLIWAALWASSLFIWDIEVTGNVNIGTGEILAALEDAGVGIGTFGPSVNQEDIRSLVLLRLHDLSWITVNFTGSRAQVIVRERVPKPQMTDDSIPADIIAARSGIITKVCVYEGKSLLKAGDSVVAGDTLVSGTVESLSSGVRDVHARAEIYARTWYEISERIPAMYGEKVYTGKKFSRKALIFFGKRLNLYFSCGISYAACDKIIERSRPSLPGGVFGFLGLETETYYPYEIRQARLSIKEAEEILSPRLYDVLSRTIDGEIVSSEITAEEENGVINVTLRAECLEQIACTRERE